MFLFAQLFVWAPQLFVLGGSRSGAHPDKASLLRCLIPNLIRIRRIADGRRKRFVIRCKNRETPLPHPRGANSHAEQNLMSKYAPESPILISVQSARYCLRFSNKISDLGVICFSSPDRGADPNGEHKLTRPHSPDASYLIWFESAGYFQRSLCEMLSDGRTRDPFYEVISGDYLKRLRML